jgi:nucleotide-binding universal stress UspA family protein
VPGGFALRERIMSTGRIVVGVDGSEPSRDALRWASTQAEATGTELVAVAAWSYPAAAYPTLAGYVPVTNAADLESDTRAAIGAVVKDTLGDRKVTLSVVEGHPANVIVDAARGASLVVVGCRGHGGFVGALLGSVSQHVVAHATCPVVVIRHPKEPHV